MFRRYALDEALKREHEGRGYGIDAETWQYNTPNATIPAGICVQDFCEVLETENIKTKLQFVKDHLERSRDGNEPTLYLNFLTASNFWKIGCWPDRIAAKILPDVVEHLAVGHRVDGGDATTGVVVTDFVGGEGGWAVFRLVVGMNAALLVD